MYFLKVHVKIINRNNNKNIILVFRKKIIEII